MPIKSKSQPTSSQPLQQETAGLNPPFEPGIYFGLPEDVYHSDNSLGSSDLKLLNNSPPQYWFKRMSGQDDDPETRSRVIGRAVHRIVLEGMEAYQAGFHVEPDVSLKTVEDLMGWIRPRAPNFVKGSKLKAEIIAQVHKIAKTLGHDVPPIYDEFKARAESAGAVILKREEHERIIFASAQIAATPDLSNAFKNGYPEVSVFWEDDHGNRRKARFDFMKPRASVDLKSIRPLGNEPFSVECRKAFCKWEYDVQAGAYTEARRQLPALHAAGRVFGDHNAAWLEDVCKHDPDKSAFVFVFWASQGAPLCWGCTLSPKNPILDIARIKISNALNQFQVYSQRFAGDAQPWANEVRLEELDMDDLPPWFGR